MEAETAAVATVVLESLEVAGRQVTAAAFAAAPVVGQGEQQCAGRRRR